MRDYRDDVEKYVASGGRLPELEHGWRLVVMTTTGARSGSERKIALMRIEHEGSYAVVGSRGGAATGPGWVANLRAEPRVSLQDGSEVRGFVASELEGPQRALWWKRAVAAYPPYTEYQQRTRRLIPIFELVAR